MIHFFLRQRFYYGWVIVGVLVVAGISQVGEYNPALAVFMNPLQREFGWSRAEIAGVVALGTFGGAFVSPVAGWLLDRYGARWVLVGAQAVYGAGLIALSFMPDSLPFFFVAYGVGRAAVTGACFLAGQVAVANWFVLRRGSASGILRMADRGSQAVVPALLAFVVQRWGWRSGWLGLGMATWAVAILPTALLVRRRPETLGLLPDGVRPALSAGVGAVLEPVPPGEVSWTLREALRTRSFWLLLLAGSATATVGPAFNLHFLPHMLDRGFPIGVAVGLVSLLYVAAALGSLAGGWLQDRYPLRQVLSALLLVCAAGMAGMLVSPTLPYTVVFALGYGFCFGGVTTLTYVIWTSYNGRDRAGAIAGAAQPLQFVLGSVSPVYGGWVFDQTGSYAAAFVLWSAALGIGAVAALTARPPPRRANAAP